MKKLTFKQAYNIVERKKHGGRVPKKEERDEPKSEKRAEIRAAKKLVAQSVQRKKKK